MLIISIVALIINLLITPKVPATSWAIVISKCMKLSADKLNISA